MRKTITIIAVLISIQTSFAQKTHNLPDSLAGRDFGYLQEKAAATFPDPAMAAMYNNAWIAKANALGDWEQAALAYRLMAHRSKHGERLVYADSMITAANKSKDNSVIGSAFLTRGLLYYTMEDHTSAIDNYIVANRHLVSVNDLYLMHKVKYAIAMSKFYLGFYDEALSLFKECVNFYENTNDRAYINSLHALGMCYNKLGNINLSSETNLLGIKVSKRVGDSTLLPHFRHSEAVNTFFRENYSGAIRQLTGSLHELDKDKDANKIAESQYYIGKSWWNLGQKDKSIPYLKSVVRAYHDKKYQRPELRGAFELLINYAKAKGDKDMQLYYVGQLMKVDSLLVRNYKYLSSRITKEYDHDELVRASEELEKENVDLKGNSKVSSAIIGVLVIGLFFFAYNYIRIRRKYKRRFVTWKNQSKAGIQANHTIPATGNAEINPELTAQILAKLERFEKNQKYTAKDMTLQKLATELDFNSKYVSRVILQHRGKKFVDYINDLKIDYVVEMLQKESRWRKYTHRALAAEAGLGSPQNFSRLFRNRMQMPPAFFIEELEKDIAANKLP